MSTASAAKRLATAAVYGGSGLSVVGAALYGVLRLEAKLARLMIGNVKDPTTPDPSGLYGSNFSGPPIQVVVLGDSSAAGYGVDNGLDTPGHTLANRFSGAVRRPVQLNVHAKVGARTADLIGQIEQALQHQPRLAVIFIGANDVTHSVRPAASVAALSSAVQLLREAGTEVVVGTCPDLGTIRPIAPPLRQLTRAWSRRLAAAQGVVTEQAGGHPVALGSLLGPHFDAEPLIYFGPDRFHPSAVGYRSLADVMVPAMVRAIEAAVTAESSAKGSGGPGKTGTS